MIVTLTALEREQLLVLSELALALRTGDGASVRALMLEVDARAVDRLADRLVVAAVPPMEEVA